ncbi:MAG: 1,4-alpha-glucan branching protein domain-containing protein, partial [Solirubrobacteraceae bacterium]
IDRAIIDLVWSARGYPAHAHYRDSHRRTVHNHNPWANDGSVYDHQRALHTAAEHARDFVQHVRERLHSAGRGLPGGGLLVFAADTELFGHWWYEGIAWLRAVLSECQQQGVALVPLEQARALAEPADMPADATTWPATSWGQGQDLSTWSCPCPPFGATAPDQGASEGEVGEVGDVREVEQVGEGGPYDGDRAMGVPDMAFATRASELQVLRRRARAGPAALRELLALQSSDWAFMVARRVAAPYARERFNAHRAACDAALRAGPDADCAGLRNLAVCAPHSVLSEP